MCLWLVSIQFKKNIREINKKIFIKNNFKIPEKNHRLRKLLARDSLFIFFTGKK